MYSKFFRHTEIDELEQQLDAFLKELEEVTGQVANVELFKNNNEVIVLVIYSCWKKL